MNALMEQAIEILLKTDPAKWLAYQMTLPNKKELPKTTGEAMDIVESLARKAIESAIENYKKEKGL